MNKNVINVALSKTLKYIFILIVISMIISYITIQIALNIKYAVDGVLFNNYDMIPKYISSILKSNYIYNLSVFAIIIVSLNFMYMILNYIRDRITTKFKLKINCNLKNKLYAHTLNLEYKNYISYEKEEIIQRINEDAEVYSEFFNSQFNLILDIIFLSIFIITESIELNFIIALYIFTTIVIMLLFAFWYLKKLNKSIEELIYRRKKILKSALINVSNFKLIRMFNKQKEEINNYSKLNNEYTKTDINFIKLVLFYEIINDHITYLNSPIIYMIGGIAVISRENDNGRIRSFNNIIR